MGRNGEAHAGWVGARNHHDQGRMADAGHPLMANLEPHAVEHIAQQMGPHIAEHVFGAVIASEGGESHEGIGHEMNPTMLGEAMKRTAPKGSMSKARWVGKDVKPWKSFN
jgi:hypothetical protein